MGYYPSSFWLKCIAGIGLVSGSMLLMWRCEYEKAMILLVGLMSFFVGEQNGKRQATQN